jgi:hypothetical protein
MHGRTMRPTAMRFTDDKPPGAEIGDRLAEIEQRLKRSHEAIEQAAEARRAALERLARRAAERAEEAATPQHSAPPDEAA